MLAEIMAGNASRGADRRPSSSPCARRGRPWTSSRAWPRTMRALATPVPCERDDLVDTAGHRRRALDVQRLDDRGADRRRRRLRAGQARQPLGHRAVAAAPTSSRRWARASTSPRAPSRSCIDEAGFGFMFAPAHHQATRYVVPVRKELAVRTIFNFLGPLTNPAGARRQLIGVSDPAYIERMAGALARLGVDRALVVSSEDGLDEMSTSAPTHVVEVNGDAIERYVVAPQRRRDRAERRPTPSPAAPPTTTRRPRARSSPASRARRATSRCSTPAPRSTPPAWPTRLREGVEAAREAVDSGAAARTHRRLRLAAPLSARARRASAR